MKNNETVYQVLSKIQKELKVSKGQYNSFGKYKYRSCEDIVEAVKPLLPDGYVLLLSDTIELIGDRYYVKATAKLTNGSEEVTNQAYARESLDKKGMDDSQITGATSSYARKYSLNGLLGIDDTKDADTQDNTKEEPKKVIKKESDFQTALRVIKETGDVSKLTEFESKIQKTSKYSDEEKTLLLDAILLQISTIQG